VNLDPAHSRRSPRLAAGVVAALVMSGCAAASSDDLMEESSDVGVQEAYIQVLETVNEYEAGAQSAAQADGPVGLADFAITNGDRLLDATTVLNGALDRDPGAQGFPEPELIAQAAAGATVYAESLSLVADRLAQCPEGDEACYDEAYDSGATGSEGRDQFRQAVAAIQEVAQSGNE